MAVEWGLIGSFCIHFGMLGFPLADCQCLVRPILEPGFLFVVCNYSRVDHHHPKLAALAAMRLIHRRGAASNSNPLVT